MKSAKERTIDYLESIKKDRLNALEISEKDFHLCEILEDINILDSAIKVVEESEGE